MKSISIPFRFSNGGVAITTDLNKITEQKIIDVLVTAPGERVIYKGYGANLRALLYEPLDDLIFADFKVDAIQDINESLDTGKVSDIIIGTSDNPAASVPDQDSLTVRVIYKTTPYDGGILDFNVSASI